MAAFASLVCGSEETKGSVHPGGSSWIKIKDGRITADINDMELAEVLNEISRKAKINFTIGEGVKDRISIKFTGATIEEALRRLCENRAIVFEYQPEKQAYRIVSVGAYSKGKSEKDKSSPTDKSLLGDNMQKQESRRSNKKVGSAKGERLYDSRGRLLYKPGELLVKFKKGATEKQIADLHKSLGSTVLRRIDRLRLERIKLRKGFREQEAIEAYFASGFVEIAERHALRYANATIPNDEYLGEQWGLAKIHAQEAWDITTGSPEIIIAVIDTGVDYLHPDLSDNIWINTAELQGVEGVDDDGNRYVDDIYGWDFAGNDETEFGDADPMDVDGHGTHVAGIIAAKADNALGIAGVCWNAKIMSLKVQADGDEYMEGMAILQAMHYAIDNGARIVNCSFGGEGEEMSEFGAVAEFQDSGIIAVCAAGNDGTDNDVTPKYPASYELDNIIAVAANNESDNLAGVSNYGKTSVDVMAPGVDIKSTIPASSFDIMSGTSMAAPHVSGIAGLILSKNSGLDYSSVKSLILDTVDKVSSVSEMLVSGGRVNAFAAVDLVISPGDVSDNDSLGLEDVILALQIAAGMHPNICDACIQRGVDVNGDRRIGLEESIYVMQKIAGVRE